MNTTFFQSLTLSVRALVVLGCAILVEAPKALAQNNTVHPLGEFTELKLKGNHDVTLGEDGTFGC